MCQGPGISSYQRAAACSLTHPSLRRAAQALDAAAGAPEAEQEELRRGCVAGLARTLLHLGDLAEGKAAALQVRCQQRPRPLDTPVCMQLAQRRAAHRFNGRHAAVMYHMQTNSIPLHTSRPTTPCCGRRAPEYSRPPATCPKRPSCTSAAAWRRRRRRSTSRARTLRPRRR